MYLTSNPNVTFFKMVYRRHTNFSKDELDLTFNNKLSFGKEGYCKIEHYGDLCSKVYLSMKLPEINIYYDIQTVKTIQDLLKTANIIWNPVNVNPQSNFNEELNIEAQRLINLKIVDINKELIIIDTILDTLNTNGIFNSQIWQENNPNGTPSDYINDILLNYIQYDKYNLLYKIIDAYINDITKYKLLANSTQLLQIIFNLLLNNVTSEDFNPLTYNDANIQFLYYAMNTNYNIYNSVQSATLFETSIKNTYEMLNTKYTQLDAYKIFTYMMKIINTPIDINFNVNSILTILNNTIYQGLQENIILLNNTYNSLSKNINFTFYRLFTNMGGNQYNINSLFTNTEKITNSFANIFSQSSLEVDYSYYKDNINKSINNFQDNITSVFRNNNYNQYFNNLNLWSKTIIPGTKFYFLNNIWILMNEDIPKALVSYAQNNLSGTQMQTLLAILNNIQITIQNVITPKINATMTQSITNTLNSYKNANDIMITAIFNSDNNKVNNVTIPEYIITTYTNAITSITNIDDRIIDNLIIIINSFVSTTIPTYSQTLNFTYVNIISSIFNNIFTSFITNYNGMYNNNLLSYNNFKNNIGIEMLEYLINVSNVNIGYDINSGTTYDYFRNLNYNIDDINNYLGTKLNVLISELNYYANNKSLLGVKNMLISKPQYFYNQYQIVLDFIINTIKNNPQTYNYTTNGQSNDIVDLIYQELSNTSVEYISPRNNATDILNIINIIITTFITQQANTFTTPNLSSLWEESTFDETIEENNFNNLFGLFYGDNGPQNLYKFNQQIMAIYDNFDMENDVIYFMKDYIIQNSFLKDINTLLGEDINETYLNVLNYFVGLRNDNRNIYNILHGDPLDNDSISLSETLNLAITSDNIRAKFAWIKKLGHYLINSITIKFDDQTITTLYGEWLEIWYSLTKNINKEIGYNKLIGNITELYTFDNRIKPAYELIIPIPFWFCRHPGSALPLVAMFNTEIKIYVKLKDFNDVAYYDSLTAFRVTPKLSCKMIAEYIYLEDKERCRIAKSKLQYQIDILQYNGDIIVTKDSFPHGPILKTLTRFNNSCKEFFWVLQDLSYINGSLPNGERKWDKYDYLDGDTLINPIKQTSIQFNGRDRERFKDSIFYNYIQPYMFHQADPSLGVNIYSFSLDPTGIQPSGTANMSKIDDAGISITLMPNVVDDLNNNKVVFRFAIYSLSLNFLRVCSGMAGVMYYS